MFDHVVCFLCEDVTKKYSLLVLRCTEDSGVSRVFSKSYIKLTDNRLIWVRLTIRNMNKVDLYQSNIENMGLSFSC